MKMCQLIGGTERSSSYENMVARNGKGGGEKKYVQKRGKREVTAGSG
jgi:hypothetical protein